MIKYSSDGKRVTRADDQADPTEIARFPLGLTRVTLLTACAAQYKIKATAFSTIQYSTVLYILQVRHIVRLRRKFHNSVYSSHYTVRYCTQ